MAYRHGTDRRQMMVLPPTLDQYVSQDHPVRAYDAFVDALNFRELGIELDEGRVGNSEYDPVHAEALVVWLLLRSEKLSETRARGLQQSVLHLADEAVEAGS